ncbi:25974_t:CDS:2 [Racocetra persica]|uniref:25974_t:CDS:1 n=1 Tax=Racocetra persica TaxID=160502 RepID=A0ACA9KGT7_9GLOM|nr:25974_t:CDS:2 [Racocetra persica]
MADTQSRIDSLSERISKFEETDNDHIAAFIESAEHKARIAKLEQNVTIAKKFLIEYSPVFLKGLEFDALFRKYQITLETQGSKHRFHDTSWYKVVKKFEDIVNRDRLK